MGGGFLEKIKSFRDLDVKIAATFSGKEGRETGNVFSMGEGRRCLLVYSFLKNKG